MRPAPKRTLRRLPQLEPRKDALEKCVYCPKLCRSACPVSNAEPTETLTPWGKMSLAYFLATESVEMAPAFAKPAWACTGCGACKAQCDHENDVSATLLAARAGLRQAGVAPPEATTALARFEEHARELEAATARIAPRRSSRNKLLLGCGYARSLPDESADAIRVAEALLGPVELLDLCCGLPLLEAGDVTGFVRQREEIRRAVSGADRVVVLDPGCGGALRRGHAHAGEPLPVKVELLVEVAHASLPHFDRAPGPARAVRYHDPCKLGRGLGIYEEPRALLTRVLGVAPLEFPYARGGGACAGGGGLLPQTMPEVARGIASRRVDEHARAGGGEVVTACSSSLRMLRNAGAEASDLVTWLARGLGA